VATHPIQILLAEDNPGDARIVRELLRDVPDLSIHMVDRLADAVDFVSSGKADIVLLDLGFPESQGLSTLRTVFQAAGEVPIIVLTGQDDEALGQLAVKEGAQDFLSKGQVTSHILTRSVRYAIERTEARARIRLSEARLIEAQRIAHIGTWTWDADTGSVLWSDELYRIAGLDPGQTASSYADQARVFLPESWARLNRAVDSSRKTGEAYALELELLRPDGSTRWVQAVGGVRRGARKQVDGLLGTVQDITERKRTEFALKEQLEELRNWQDVTIGREMKMIELKREVNELLALAGQPARYLIAEEDAGGQG